MRLADRLIKFFYPGSGMFVSTDTCSICQIQDRCYFIGFWRNTEGKYFTSGINICRKCLLNMAIAIKPNDREKQTGMK